MDTEKLPAHEVVRNPAYAARLIQACENSPHCPPHFGGRSTWLIEQLKQRYQIEVTIQTASRWFNGIARPREDKSDKIAQILGVSPTWLFVGVEEVRKSGSWVGRKAADAAVDAAAALLEVHEAMGSGGSHTAIKLRKAIEEYHKVA